jgi:hypothetical protein
MMSIEDKLLRGGFLPYSKSVKNDATTKKYANSKREVPAHRREEIDSSHQSKYTRERGDVAVYRTE